MKALSSVFVLLLGLSGCVATEDFNRAMSNLDATWGDQNTRLEKTLGTRYYKVTKVGAIRGMVIALSNLGMTIKNQDFKTGILLATSIGPTPLSPNEWKHMEAVEMPRAKKIIEPDLGIYSEFLQANPKYSKVNVNVFFLERSKDRGLQISIRFALEYVGPGDPNYHYSTQPPPLGAQIALKKVWNEFEKTLFVQKKVLGT